MRRTFMCGLAAIVGLVTMAGAAMAHHTDVDVLMLDLQPNVGIYELSLMSEHAAVLAEIEVTPDVAPVAAVVALQSTSLTEPLTRRGAASSTMADDAMRLWRARTVAAFTISPGLLI